MDRALEILYRTSQKFYEYENGKDISTKEIRKALSELDESYSEMNRVLDKETRILLLGNPQSVFLIKHSLRLKMISGGKWKVGVYWFHDDSFQGYKKYFDEFIEKEPLKSRSVLNKLLTCLGWSKTFKEISRFYQIININFLKSIYFCDFLKNTLFSREDPRLITTMWGNDMFQETKSKSKKRLHLSVLKISKLITLANSDLKIKFREIYGSEFDRKLRLAAFGSPIDVLLMESMMNTSVIGDFYRKYKISPDKLKITISSSADPLENHLYIISEINSLPPEIKKGIILLVPMTYGDLEYRKSVLEILENSGLDYVVFKDYLSDFEISILKAVSDITIFIPETDAFSAFLQETIYFGSVVITGIWLPYSWIRKNGIHVHFVSGYNEGELRNTVEKVIENIEMEKKKASDNKMKILKTISWQYNLINWLRIYKEVLGS